MLYHGSLSHKQSTTYIHRRFDINKRKHTHHVVVTSMLSFFYRKLFSQQLLFSFFGTALFFPGLVRRTRRASNRVKRVAHSVKMNIKKKREKVKCYYFVLIFHSFANGASAWHKGTFPLFPNNTIRWKIERKSLKSSFFLSPSRSLSFPLSSFKLKWKLLNKKWRVSFDKSVAQIIPTSTLRGSECTYKSNIYFRRKHQKHCDKKWYNVKGQVSCCC